MRFKMSQKNIPCKIIGIVTAWLIVGCSEPIHSPMTGTTNLSSISSPEAVAAFQSSLHPLLTANCGGCHGSSQMPMFATLDVTASQNILLSYGLVDFNLPANSRIVIKIKSGHQNFISSQPNLPDQLQAAITTWATAVQASGVSIPSAAPLEPTFQSISTRILQPKCVACHGPTLAKSGFRYDSYSNTIKTVNLNPGKILESKLYTEVANGSMPQDTPLTAEEVTVIRDWLEAGALNN